MLFRSIGFWVNKKSEDNYWFTPIFTAYGAAPTDDGDGTKSNGMPMFLCTTRGTLQLNNNGGWCNYAADQNDKGSNYEGTYWLDNTDWHFYTLTLTQTSAKIYIDGVILNSWTLDGSSSGQDITNFFTNGDKLTYICLGGNQAWDWDDDDPAFGFDDFAVYDVALSAAQIKKIMADKMRITSIPCTLDFSTWNSTNQWPRATVSPFDNGEIVYGNSNFASFKMYNGTATAYFDSDTSVDGNQPYTLESNEQVVISFVQYNGYLGSACTSTFAIENSTGTELLSYQYNAKSGNIENLKIGGSTPDGFAAFECRSYYGASSSANGFDGNGKPYVTTSGYNPIITIAVAEDGTVSVNFTQSQRGLNSTFTRKLSEVAMDLANLKISSSSTNDDRISGYGDISIKSQFKYTVQATVGGEPLKTLATGAFDRDGSATVYWNKFIEQDGVWYETTSPYGSVISSGGTTNISFTESEIDYFIEAEDMTASRTYGEITNDTKYSNGAGPGLYSDATLTSKSNIEVSAGSYTLTVGAVHRSTNYSQNYSIKNSTDAGANWSDLGTVEFEKATANDITTASVENITLPSSSLIRLAEPSSNNARNYLDYITLTRTKCAYTVKYMCGEDEIKTADASRTGKWGTYATLTDADKEQIEYDGNTYSYVSDDASSQAISTDGSTVITVTFVTACANPTYEITAPDGTARKFTLATATADATIYYSTTEKLSTDDGWTTYSGEVTTDAETIWVCTKKAGYNDSEVISFSTGAGSTIALNAPTITRIANTSVTITSDQSDKLGEPVATIYYRIGDSGDYSVYSSAVTVSSHNKVYAYVVASGYDNSSTASKQVSFVSDLTLVETESRISSYTSGALNTEESTVVSGRTYQPFVYDETQWGTKVFFQPDEVSGNTTYRFWGFRSGNTWYNGCARSTGGWMLIKDLSAGDIVVVQIEDAAKNSVNATYSEEYSYTRAHAYIANADGDMELRFHRKDDKGNNTFYGVSIYTAAVSVTIPSSGFGTIASAYALDLDNVTVSDGTLTAYKVNEITKDYAKLAIVGGSVAAATGLILEGKPGATCTIPVAESGTDISSTNLLQAAVNATEVAENKAYILKNGEFHKVTKASTIPAGKAYLLADDVPVEARTLSFFFEDDETTTGIADVRSETSDVRGGFFDLQGRKINGQLPKGLYIVNGKKVVIK